MKRKISLLIFYLLQVIFSLLIAASIVLGFFSHFYYFFVVAALPVVWLVLDIILLNSIRRRWGLHLVIGLTLAYVVFRYSVSIFFMMGAKTLPF
ncbi:hypothetical protein [Rossellomorea aquimaris]|uniref:hypothetical protein n=1 Tax=Rossellomorea aquimaris TaxID=189382 RepID=UPI0012518520|nr:hypothetical protein [Rossellomorea aquimaris]TYS89945.1 hypothetical protein FZC88_10210 [Rossellomorea aquimaris]